MKKIIILLICAILLCGCGNGNMVKSQKTTQNNEQKYTSELFAIILCINLLINISELVDVVSIDISNTCPCISHNIKPSLSNFLI